MRSIKRNDTVLVISGKDRGKTGAVRQVITKKDRILVDGINIMKKHQRPTQTGGVPVPGSIVERESPLHISNVKLICKSCQKPVRTGSRIRADGIKVRVCRNCGEDVD